MTNKTLLERRKVLEQDKRRLADELKEVTELITECDKALVNSFLEAGVSKVTDSVFTYYLEHKTRARVTEPDKLVQGMHKAGLDYMLTNTIHHQRLDSWVKDLPEDSEGNVVFPNEELKASIGVYNQTLLRIRKK